MVSQTGFQLSTQQFWLWQLQQQDAVYTAQCVVEIQGNLDETKLKRSIQAVVGQHEILRTTFQVLPGMTLPCQVVTEECRFSWQTLGCLQEDTHTGHCTTEGEKLYADFTDFQDSKSAYICGICVRIFTFEVEDDNLVFDLESGPLLHFSLLKCSEYLHRLIITMPSLCTDEASFRNFVKEVSEYYGAD